jgi:selenocysteine lyase/cysteine desulfurase
MNARTMFPVLNNTTYLNTAGSGILSDSLFAWRREHDAVFLQTGSDFRLQQALFLKGVKDSVAAFFHHDVSLSFLTPNFSTGYTTLLEGLSADHRFLQLTGEFPSVYYQVRSRGFTYDEVAQGEHLEERIIDKIKAFKPTVFAFSIVQYSNGVKLEQSFFRELKSMFPDLLLVADGTQYCGTEEIDFSTSALDALLGSGYKWLLGGYGNGYALLKKPLADLLYKDEQGKPLPTEAFMKDRSRLSLRFEPGHQDTLCFGSLQHSISFLQKTGLSLIEKQIKSLAQQAKTAMADRGLLDNFIAERPHHSAILRLNISDKLIQKIQEANITGTSRGDGFRISFHFYNEMNDLNRLLEVIDANL